MKTALKKYMMAIVAVMLVIGFSAFKVTERSTVELGKLHTTDANNNPIILYVDLTNLSPDDHDCVASSNTCKSIYHESDLDENRQPLPEAEPISSASGDFMLY